MRARGDIFGYTDSATFTLGSYGDLTVDHVVFAPGAPKCWSELIVDGRNQVGQECLTAWGLHGPMELRVIRQRHGDFARGSTHRGARELTHGQHTLGSVALKIMGWDHGKTRSGVSHKHVIDLLDRAPGDLSDLIDWLSTIELCDLVEVSPALIVESVIDAVSTGAAGARQVAAIMSILRGRVSEELLAAQIAPGPPASVFPAHQES